MPVKLSKKEWLVIKKFKIALKKALGRNLVEVRLFGSKARGDAQKDSDIDVIIIVDGDWHMCDIVYDIVTSILLEEGIFISPKVINKADYDHLYKIGTPFIKNVIRDGIII